MDVLGKVNGSGNDRNYLANPIESSRSLNRMKRKKALEYYGLEYWRTGDYVWSHDDAEKVNDPPGSRNETGEGKVRLDY